MSFKSSWFLVFLLCLTGMSQALEPVNPNAIPEVGQVLDYLTGLPAGAANRVIASQHLAHAVQNTGTGFDNFVQSLYTETGKWPGMISTDYGNDATPEALATANQILIDYWNAGGLIALDMHPDNPWTGGNAWDLGDRNLLDLITTGTAVNASWTAYLDIIADGLLALQDAGVVVLWRPFHEMNYRECFWWDMGAVLDDHPEQGETVWQQFWDYHFDYFTYDRGLNNLLWVYAAANTDGYASAWNDVDRVYPGNNRVDLVGIDCYGDIPTIQGQGYEKMQATGKPFALTECGPYTRDGSYDNTLMIETIRNNYPAAVYCNFWHSWTDNPVAIVDNQHAAEFLNDPWIITRDEIAWLQASGISTKQPPSSQISPFPNPVRGNARISFDIDGLSGNSTEISIYALDGTLITDVTCSSGDALCWPLKDAAGRRLPGGVYVYRSRTSRQTVSGKFTILY